MTNLSDNPYRASDDLTDESASTENVPSVLTTIVVSTIAVSVGVGTFGGILGAFALISYWLGEDWWIVGVFASVPTALVVANRTNNFLLKRITPTTD
jgi:hypothetical protein